MQKIKAVIALAVTIVLVIGLITTLLPSTHFFVNAASTRPALADNAATTISIAEGAAPIGVMPARFVGLSFEASELSSHSAPNTHFDPVWGNIEALFQTLGVGNIRIGGNSLDHRSYWQASESQLDPPWGTDPINQADIEQLASLAHATNWQVELGVNLYHLDPASVTDETRAAYAAFGNLLVGIECGNEPNDYPNLKGQANAYPRYRAAFVACANAVLSGYAQARIAGPDTLGAYIFPLVQDEPRYLSLVTQHFYALNNCGGTKKPTIRALLSPATLTFERDRVEGPLQAAQSENLPLRLDESNTANCGGVAGISNTYASALWAVDSMLAMAQAGVAGINFHGGLSVCTPQDYSAMCARSSADLAHNLFSARPLYYGILLVSMMGTGNFLPLTLSTTQNITAYALEGSDGKICVMIVDKDKTSQQSVSVLLRTGSKSTSASVITLTGPSLASTSGVAIQGETVNQNGQFATPTPDQFPVSNGSVSLLVKAGSASLITLS